MSSTAATDRGYSLTRSARHHLVDEKARPAPGRDRVDVLVAAQRREAVRKGGDHRSHLPRADESIETLGNTGAEELPADVARPTAEKPDQIHEQRIVVGRVVVVLGKVERHDPLGRIPQKIPLERVGSDRQLLEPAAGRLEVVFRHGAVTPCLAKRFILRYN